MSLPTTTPAVVLRELGTRLNVEQLEIPPLRPGQVLVEILHSGVCHTQRAEVMGLKGEDRFLPHTLGHEGVGRILAVGENIQKVSVGETVVLTWIKGIGADVQSTRYPGAHGVVNSGAIATFQRYAILSENRCVPLRVDIPLEVAALLGCAIPTGAGIVRHALDLHEDEGVVIIGAGGVGLAALIAAKAAGAHPLIVVDRQVERLAKARELGATHLIDARQHDPLAAIHELTQGDGLPYAIESAGQIATMELAINAVQMSSGLAVLAGNPPLGERLSIDPYDLIRGKRVIGSWGGSTDPDRDIPFYAEAIASGAMPFGALVDRTYALSQVNDALSALVEGTVGRALLQPQARAANP